LETHINKEERKKNLKLIMDKLNKEIGAGTVMTLKDSPLDIEVISTGSIALNAALGVGGFPKGRIVEIYGQEMSGKTTLAIHAMAECQKLGGVCVLIDAEHSFDKKYAEALGVNTDELIVNQPDYGEQGLEVAEKLISSGTVDLVVVDSIAALVPKGELEGEMGESRMGGQARMLGQALRKLTGTVSKNNVLLIFINQLREKIGVIYGSPLVTSGGNAMRFYASIRLDVSKSLIKDGDEITGNKTKVKVIKNKVACPFKIAEFDINYGEGISKVGEIVDIGSDLGIIKKGGSWYSYGDIKLGQGRDNVIKLLKDNPELEEELKEKILNYGK